MHLPRPDRPRSLAGQLFAMQAVLVAVVVAGCALFTYVSDRGQAEEAAAARPRRPPDRWPIPPPSGRRSAPPTRRRSSSRTRCRCCTTREVDFVTIMNPQRIRWTHPDQDQIGQHFLGHIGGALEGRTFTETYTGTLGPSVRVVTPIEDDGRIVGLVSAGITVEVITQRVQDQLMALFGVAGRRARARRRSARTSINARLRRHTHGMNATELSRMHDYHQAALHAVREGLLMLDGQYRVALINDGGRELLGVTSEADVVGRSVAELGLPAPLTGALLASEPRVDEVHLTADRVLVVNTSPVSGGERRGTVVTLRDVTELQSLMGELDSERGFTQALRSQAHEAANRLHTVVSLIELGRAEEAVDFATAELELAQALTDQVVAAVERAGAGRPAAGQGRPGQRAGRGAGGLGRQPHRRRPAAATRSPPGTWSPILGNLIDNAVDAAPGQRAPAPGHGDGVHRESASCRSRSPTPEPASTPPTPRRSSSGAGRRSGRPGRPGARPGARPAGGAPARGSLTVAEADGGGAQFEVRLSLGGGIGSQRVLEGAEAPGSGVDTGGGASEASGGSAVSGGATSEGSTITGSGAVSDGSTVTGGSTVSGGNPVSGGGA